MSRICTSIHQLIGRTPLLELTNLEKKSHLKARILAKLEFFNPAGSAKDRVALAMIRDAEACGALKPGGTIIEPTSGNTGIALASLSAALGYSCIIVMPDSMSRERQTLIRASGARLVLTPGEAGMTGAIARAEALVREIPNSFMPDQFRNPANPRAHYQTTGPEIWEETQGYVDIFVAGVGTGGTLSGAGGYLKLQNPAIQLMAVEPAESPVLSGGQPGPHGIQGIGAGFIPEVFRMESCDEIIPVATAQALETARTLAANEGILTGISSGAALFAALALAERPENAGKTIVTLFPDSGERYLSTPLFRK